MRQEPSIVFIGGLGGSGTRAVAGAVAKLGYYPSGCLNASNDNLIFTELFKHPDWVRGGADAREIDARLKVFERVMTRGVGILDLIRRPGLSQFKGGQGSALWGRPDAIGWMTKEPNCHIFAEHILTRWPQARFIYVTRHPLDMAFSDNRGQLGNWGWMFDLDPEAYSSPEAAQLEYWIRTQRRLDALLERFGDRMYPLNFDAFADDPAHALGQAVEHLSLPVDHRLIPEAVSEVVKPESSGRWMSRDLSMFDADQIAFCASAGWPVEQPTSKPASNLGGENKEPSHE